MKFSTYLFIACSFLTFTSCKESTDSDTNDTHTDSEEKKQYPKAESFDENAAFSYIEKQLSFGPRIPGTPAQQKCASFFIEELKHTADTVFVQKTVVKVGKKSLPCINIVGSINPQASYRILFLAHWDTRYAATDEPPGNKMMDGADDGASGVAILLQLAKMYKGKLNNIGFDILLVDVEDYGNEGDSESWCLGSQYWASNKHLPNYTAEFGVLLDMVGAKNATFFQEMSSKRYAPNVINEVWEIASNLGYGNVFLLKNGMEVQDDHRPINEIANIPCIDILNSPSEYEFPFYHHTTKDNISIIDKNMLKTVGSVMSQLIAIKEAEQGAKSK